MATILTDFTAVGNGNQVYVKNKDKVTYTVTGTFAGTWVVERTFTGGQSWESIATGTGTQSATTISNGNQKPANYRFRCSAYTSGTMETSLAEVSTEVAQSFKNKLGTDILEILENGIKVYGDSTVTGTSSSGSGSGSGDFSAGTLLLPQTAVPAQTAEGSAVWDTNDNLLTVGTGSGRKTMTDTDSTQTISGKTIENSSMTITQEINFQTGSKAGATSGWVIGGATNNSIPATLPQSQSGSTLVIPLQGFSTGDIITVFYVIGQIESAGGSVTLDANLRKITTAAGDLVDASVDSITQLVVTADTAVSSVNASKTLGTPEVVAGGETFYVLITATTAASTDIAFQGIGVQFSKAFSNEIE